MTILNRYIAKMIIVASLLVILVVLGLSFFISLLGELRDIGTGDYGFQQALFHSFLKIPHDLYQFFPMLMLLGAVLGLGMLSTYHELMVMRTSGMSIYKVIGSTFIAAALLIGIGTVIGEAVAPRAIFLADKYKETAENSGEAIATKEGAWIHEGNNFLHVDRVIGHHRLEGVKRYQFDAHHHLLAAYYAKSLDFQKGHWQIEDMVKTSLGNDRTFSQHYKSGVWDLALNPNLLTVGMVEPEELSLPSLVGYCHHLVENKLQAGQFQFELWKRFFQPLTTLVMILLAVPFIFGAPRSLNMGWRILFSVMVGFAFYIMNNCVGQMSVVFQISPMVAAVFPTLIFAGVGYFFILRMR